MRAETLNRAVVAGAGTMGPLIASAFAGAGIGVTLWNRSRAGLDRAAALLTANGAGAVEMTTDEACFAGAPFVIECIAEDAAQKREFYRRVGPLLAPDGVLATNTSGLSITALAEGAAAPERFCGMHWINPPQLIPLVEVVRGEKTAADTAQSVFTLALRLGKKPILARDVPGFVLNRLQFAVLREALHLVDSGAAGIEDVDGAMKYGLGLRYACLGPFETADLGGLDVFSGIAGYLFADLDNSAGAETLRRLVSEGALGVKSGRGFYEYPGDRGRETVAARNKNLSALQKALSEKE
ncbi:MAG TPA: 3-hydroxyacyl-CoA dehydrogenase NAD-binding domain-containing protein [Oscillospiraceae bacterium]|nr:3-hydroxyacyl-CoA dehydrogenase NAD-binding domain-containing protein [Oscillospiraceae bacterium]